MCKKCANYASRQATVAHLRSYSNQSTSKTCQTNKCHSSFASQLRLHKWRSLSRQDTQVGRHPDDEMLGRRWNQLNARQRCFCGPRFRITVNGSSTYLMTPSHLHWFDTRNSLILPYFQTDNRPRSSVSQEHTNCFCCRIN